MQTQTFDQAIDMADRLGPQLRRVLGSGYDAAAHEDGRITIGYLSSDGSGFRIGSWTTDEATEAFETLRKLSDGAGADPEGDSAVWLKLPEPNPAE